MGKVVPGSSAQSSATEAVFSKDGLVKKRIKNFETTIVDTSDNVLVFPPKQLNNTEIDIPEVLDSVTAVSDEADSENKSPKRQGVMLVGLIVVITFSWSIYSLFFSVKQPIQEANSSSEIELAGVVSDSQISKLVKLEQSANLLTGDLSWNRNDINTFLNLWNQLNEKEIAQAMATSWYQLLEFNVKKQLADIRELNLAGASKPKNEQSLMTLGLVMGIMDQATTDDVTVAESPNKQNYKQLLAELTDQLVDADKRSKTTLQAQESESSLYEKLRKEFAGSRSLESADTRKDREVLRSKPGRSVASVANTPKQVFSPIKKNEIEAIVSSYKTAYENGDIALMAQLFGASNTDSNTYKKVTSNFKSTFTNTKNRSLNFYDTESHVTANKAVVEGKYNASIDFNNGKGTQYTVANVRIHLSKNDDKVILNRIDILDKKVNVVRKEPKRSTSSNGMIASLGNKVSFPTAAELQDIATQLVTSYETGDLDQFLALFSSEIKTNDRIDLSGVKQDYSQLFASTSDRQMFIQNLKWSKENIGAKGTGDLEVIILSDEGSTVYSMEGKIQIVAQKIDNQVKITHLYHIEREK